MPNYVADFVPWRVSQIVADALGNIGLHAGYNTQPSATMDYEEFRQSGVDYSLFVDCPDLRIIENDIGDGTTGATRTTPEIVLTIYGSAKTQGSPGTPMILALVQDVLTALSALPKGMRTAVGRGMIMRVGDVQTATFDLSGKRESVFTLEVVFRYLQGSTW